MQSYLIVTKWKGDKIIHTNDPVTFALIRRVAAQGAKARRLAIEYAKQLNKGISYGINDGRHNLVSALVNDEEYYTVCAIPDSQAREYNNYLSLEECQVFVDKR